MTKANEAQYADYLAATQRDDESVTSTDLIAAYQQGIDDLRAAVAGMTAEQVLARPIPGKWSTLEVVAHLADTEIYYTDRIERTLALERPLLLGTFTGGCRAPRAGRGEKCGQDQTGPGHDARPRHDAARQDGDRSAAADGGRTLLTRADRRGRQGRGYCLALRFQRPGARPPRRGDRPLGADVRSRL